MSLPAHASGSLVSVYVVTPPTVSAETRSPSDDGASGSRHVARHMYPGSSWHVALQPSPDAALKSSHCSPAPTTPSPQKTGRAVDASTVSSVCACAVAKTVAVSVTTA